MNPQAQATAEALKAEMDRNDRASRSMLKLYEHIDQYQIVLDWIEEHEDDIREAGGELPPELDALLEQVEGDVREKIERVGLMVMNLKANAKAAGEEAGRLSAIASSYDRQADALKKYLGFQLYRLGEPRIETPRVKVRLQKNSRPTIRPFGSEIPERFQRVRIEFDGQKAYEEAKAKGLIPDAPGTVRTEDLEIELGEHTRVW